MSLPQSILITLMGSLGDVARGLTLVTPLKKKFPQSLITWIVEPKCADLVRLHPQIDRVVIFERKAGLRAVITLKRELQQHRFDLCLDLQRHFKSAFFSRISGAKRIIGFNRKDSKEFNWLFSHEQIAPCQPDLPKIEHYWKFLEYLDVEVPNSAEIELQFKNQNLIFERFSFNSSDEYIILVLGSSWSSKDWPISGYQKVIADISSGHSRLKFILSGGQEHYELGQKLKNAFADRELEILNICGQSSLTELCVLVKNAKAVVGPDSGPGHLAAMFSVPFIGLFGPTDAGRTAPYGSKVSIISARIGCSPCYRRICPGLDKLCMRMIDARTVATAVLENISA